MRRNLSVERTSERSIKRRGVTIVNQFWFAPRRCVFAPSLSSTMTRPRPFATKYNDITHRDEGTGTGHRRGQRGCKHTSSGGKSKLVYYCDASSFYGTLARALNRKVSPHNRSLYKSVTVEVLSLLVSRDTYIHTNTKCVTHTHVHMCSMILVCM